MPSLSFIHRVWTLSSIVSPSLNFVDVVTQRAVVIVTGGSNLPSFIPTVPSADSAEAGWVSVVPELAGGADSLAFSSLLPEQAASKAINIAVTTMSDNRFLKAFIPLCKFRLSFDILSVFHLRKRR
jgi:hypothetical protein